MRTLLLLLCLAGCDGKKDKATVPELGGPRTSGVVMLNVAGVGYRLGDIVRINAKVGDLSKGDVVLFDWRKATTTPGGFGPGHMIGQVIGLPGDKLALSTLLKYRGCNGKEKSAWFSTFERRGARNFDGSITLVVGDYLVETERNILVVDRSSIVALVVERLGHDDEAEEEMKQRVY